MNLNPITAIRNAMRGATRKDFTNSGGELAAIIRAGDPLGPWTGAFAGFEPRMIDPSLYEAMREAIPVLDGAVGALVTLDGIVRVQGGNDKLIAEIEDWMLNVPCNDAEKGLQALYETQGNERYEQGFGIAEYIVDRKKTDVIGLRVADSKGIYFRRVETGLEVYYRPPTKRQDGSNGLDNIERILRNGLGQPVTCDLLTQYGYGRLDTSRLLYTTQMPEADNPYGTSIFRSLEFSGQSLLTIQNALQQSWRRYGDPPLMVVYKVSNKKVVDTAGELDKRRDALAKNLRSAMEQKGKGNSVDFVQAIGKDDDLKIDVIGANGVVMEIEMPARHLLEQIVAKVGLPAWMLGLQFSTSERLAEQQAGMALQAAKTRFERRRADLTALVATMLRMRGRTWKRGDWELVQELPNIQDQVKQAQAGFLRAQTALMESGAAGTDGNPRGIDNNLRASRGQAHKHARKAGDLDDEDPVGEDWAEDDPELPRIEAEAANRVRKLWTTLAEALIAALALDAIAASGDDGDGWAFDFDMLPAIVAAGAVFTAGAGAAVGDATIGAWERGLANALVDIPAASAPLSITDLVAAQLRANALAQVNATFDRAARQEIVNALIGGVYDGLSNTAVARQLRRAFADRVYDWDRLVASEMAAAQGAAKMQQFASNGIEEYDWSTAGDGRVCAICAGYRDNGPYPVGAGPLPMTSSHPLCRCSVIPVVPD